EGEDAVNHRVHRVPIDGADQRFHVAPAADADASERGLAQEHAHEVDAGAAGSERPDEGDFAAVCHRLYGLCKRPGSSDFDDAIDAPPARETAHGIPPLGVCDVVDDGIGADLLQALAVCCALRSRNHTSTEKFGKL